MGRSSKRISVSTGLVSCVVLLIVVVLWTCSGPVEPLNPLDSSVDGDGDVDADGDGDGDGDADADADGPPCYEARLIDYAFFAPSHVMVFISVTTCGDNPQPVRDLAPEGGWEEFWEIGEDGRPLTEEAHGLVSSAESGYVSRTLLMGDMSGSMLGADFTSVIDAMRAFGISVTDPASNEHQVAIHVFDGVATSRELVDFTARQSVIEEALDDLETIAPDEDCRLSGVDCSVISPDRLSCVEGYCVDESTDLYGAAMIGGIDIVTDEIEDFGGLGVPRVGTLVVFTDGHDVAARQTLGNVTPRLIGTGRSVFKGLVYTVGIGVTEEDRAILRDDLGRDGYFEASDSSGLAAQLDEVAESYEEISAGIYVISYCSGSRAGDHEVNITLRDVEDADFNIPFSAAGFGSGCDPSTSETACEGMVCGLGDMSFYCGDCRADEECTVDGVCVEMHDGGGDAGVDGGD